MTPDDIEMVRHDIGGIDADELARDFYATLFDLAPAARTMFPDDMGEQRRKLMNELATLVDLGTSAGEGRMEAFVDRAHRLGRRHVRYGAEGPHYELVGTALLSALSRAVTGWDDRHEHAWTVLYTVVAETMLEGAEHAATLDAAPA